MFRQFRVGAVSISHSTRSVNHAPSPHDRIKDDLRRDAAIEYLARADLTLNDIAGLLGFSGASTFLRAFKHWTDVAPGEYRHTRLHRRDQGLSNRKPPVDQS